MRYGSVILFVAIMLPKSAAAVDIFGQVPDEHSFRQVHTFCVDTSSLSRDQLKAEEKFIKKDNKPKKVLGDLAWKYVADCSGAEAIVSLKFTQRTQSELLSTVHGTLDPLGTAESTTTFTKVDISVARRAGEDPFYTLEGEEVKFSIPDAIESTFKRLDHDLKLLVTPAK